MSRFKTAPVAPSYHNGIVFKRRGNKVRYFDPGTATVGPWTTDPNVTMVEAKRALIKRVAEKNRARSIQNTAEALSTTTVATLRDMAKARGIKVPSKARKADIIIALTESR